MLIDVQQVTDAYYSRRPDPAIAAERVSFGTSGHRGGSLDQSFNEPHVLAICQAICDCRRRAGINGPLFVGIDTHVLSGPALISAIEVFAANGVETMIDRQAGYTPTPVVSHAILAYNNRRTDGLADGVVISPSHNPPDQGGFKYNPPHGGPAGTEATSWIETSANVHLEEKLLGVRRLPYARASRAPCLHRHDFIGPYVADIANVVDMAAISESGIRIGIDPLGGAALPYWEPIIERYGIDATVVNDSVDPTFSFMAVDWDGKIRMDCSSPYAMARLVEISDGFDIAFATDTDADRHGIVCRSSGLMEPNKYLAAACAFLLKNRPGWAAHFAVGVTIVSSGMIGRVARNQGRNLFQTPVGFKWFSAGLLDGHLAFAGEESAGASFLRQDGSVWTTDKDGLVLGLLAAEMTARSGFDPKGLYDMLSADLGTSWYARIDAPASEPEKNVLRQLSPDNLNLARLAGEPIDAVQNRAPGNGQPIGGIRVSAPSGWFAARPSGTEDVYKIYAESFRDEDHLLQIQHDAQDCIKRVFQRL
jgi:phosphoglucomutase